MRSNNRNSVISIGSAFLSICNPMKKTIAILVLSGITLLTGCGKNSSPEDTVPPAKPVLLQSATYITMSDTVCGPYDQGPNAVNGIRLMWQPPTDNDVAEWQIYYHHAYTNDSPILAGTRTANLTGYLFVVRDLRIQPDNTTDSSTMYEYWINAVDQTGNVSASSDPYRFRLIRKADAAVADTVGGIPIFHAQYSYADLLQAPDRYSLKVKNTDSLQYVWLYSRVEYQNQINVRFNEDGSADTSYLINGGRMLPGNYVVYFEFWRGDSAGSVATALFSYPKPESR